MSVVAAALAVLGGGLAGVGLSRAAFAVEAGDDLGDWRTAPRRTRATAIVVLTVLSAAAALLAWALAPSLPLSVAVTAFAATGPGLAAIDAAARRLPFAYSGVIAAIVVGALLFTSGELVPSLLMAVAVMGSLIALAALIFAVRYLATGKVPELDAGLGDVAIAGLAALTLAWSGPIPVMICLAIAMMLAGLAGILWRLARRGAAPVPFGPFLPIGWWLAYLISI